jgi:hypothetical protein
MSEISEMKSIKIDIKNFEMEGYKGVLFNCPHESKYDWYSFWYPHIKEQNFEFNQAQDAYPKKIIRARWGFL